MLPPLLSSRVDPVLSANEMERELRRLVVQYRDVSHWELMHCNETTLRLTLGNTHVSLLYQYTAFKHTRFLFHSPRI